uniref:Uncharacterized protein n=1 Tax=Tetradesmus obliquus TaxID=3088 RepID=A0A383VL41_TETOB
MDACDEPLPRTMSKTLRMDIARMASLEKEAHPATETHALSPTEHDAIMGLMDQQHKKLMYSNSLRKSQRQQQQHQQQQRKQQQRQQQQRQQQQPQQQPPCAVPCT